MKTKSRAQHSLAQLFAVMSLTAISCVLFNNCQRLDENADYNLDVPDAYKEVGVSHNEGLDYIFNKIQEYCIEYTRNLENDPYDVKSIDYPAIVREGIVEFCMANQKTKEISKLYGTSFQTGYLLKSRNVLETKPEIKVLIDKIQYVIRNEFSSKNLKQLKRELNMINQLASDQLSPGDAAAIYCATSTAYSTFQYWHKNYRAWYFALNYPEIMEQLEKSDLNKLSLKSATALVDTIPVNQSFIKTFWDKFEGWINQTGDALEYWWDEYGEKIIISDCLGAVAGAYDAAVAAGAASLVFGPEGIVVLGVGGAIVGGVDASAFAITGSGVLELVDP